MSRIVGYLIVAGVLVSPLRAQDVKQMERRLDSTFREAMLAQKAVLAYRAAHPPRFNYSDSIVAAGGKIKLYFDDKYAAPARAGFAVADKHLAELGRALQNVPPFVFTITPDSAYNPYTRGYERGGEMSVTRHYADDPNNPSRNVVDGGPESIGYTIVRTVSEWVGQLAPSHVAQWTWGYVPIAPDLDEKVDWPTIRLSMVSSPSHFGKQCYAGDIHACKVYLQLDSVADPIHALFDATGRRLRVSYDLDRARAIGRETTERCLGGNDDACVAILERIGGVSILSSPYMRTSLVTHAVRLGGARAAERLLLTPGKPQDALAAAAGMPIDSLVADWQRHLGQSTIAGNISLTILISSIAWVGLCVFFALRSSRWR